MAAPPKEAFRHLAVSILAAITFSVGHSPPAFATLRDIPVPGNPAIEKIFQDRSGDLWFVGDGSTLRYDGLRFQPKLPFAATAFCEDLFGQLWFGTPRGIVRYRRPFQIVDTVSVASTGGGLPSDSVMALEVDRNGNVWCGTSAGLARLAPDGSWHGPPGPEPFGAPRVRALNLDRKNRLWVGSDEGLAYVTLDAMQLRRVPHPLLMRRLSIVMTDSTDRVWVVPIEGCPLIVYDPVAGTAERYENSPIDDCGVADYKIQALACDLHGSILIATSDSGLDIISNVYDPELYLFYREAQFTTYNALYFDIHHNLWAAASRRLFVKTSDSFAEFTASFDVTRILEDHRGDIWSMFYQGPRRFAFGAFSIDSCVRSDTLSLFERDGFGGLWLGPVRVSSAPCYAQFFGADEGYPDSAQASTSDRLGHVWIGGVRDFARWNGARFVKGGSDQGYPHLEPYALRGLAAVDSTEAWLFIRSLSESGSHLWRFDGARWSELFGVPDIRRIRADPSGVVWFCTYQGLFREEAGSIIRVPSTDLGLPDGTSVTDLIGDGGVGTWISHYRQGDDGLSYISAFGTIRIATGPFAELFVDSRGRLWAQSNYTNVAMFMPDRSAPRVTWLPSELPTEIGESHTFVATTQAYGAVDPVQYAIFDSTTGYSDTTWTSIPAFSLDFSDGPHTLTVIGRDRVGNIDPVGARWALTVDATPPRPVIQFPRFGASARGRVAVVGSVLDDRFARYTVVVRKAGETTPLATLADTTRLVVDDTLAVWETVPPIGTPPPDGDYELEVQVRDKLGLVGAARVTFELDNQPPFDNVTVPVEIDQNGGAVFNRNADMMLFVPPNGFLRTTRVDAVDLLDPLRGMVPPGMEFTGSGDSLAWSSPLMKAAVLGLQLPESLRPSVHGSRSLVICRLEDSTWVALGGTLNRDTWFVSLPIQDPGSYALFLGTPSQVMESAGGIAGVTVTPRVFSPARGTAGANVTRISFSLPREGGVSVEVYDRAGRRVRSVVRDQPMRAGLNTVEWDGNTDDGATAEDGLYIVSVNASGLRKRSTVVLAR